MFQDVCLIAGPITDREYDPEKEKRLVRASKRKILEYLESESFLGTGKHHFFNISFDKREFLKTRRIL